MTRHSPKKGKVKTPVLIACFVVLVVFAGIAWYKTTEILPNTISISTSTPPLVIQVTSTTTATTSATTTVQKPVTIATSTILAELTTDSAHAVGIAAGGGLSKLSPADLNTELNQMVDLGVTWVRFDIEWGLVQYDSPNKSDWTSYDTLIKALNAHHIKGLGIILFTPEWARDPSCGGGAKCPPKDPNQYATFAAEVANRYKAYGVHDWEIWNEPNNYDFWATKTDCVAYTNLLKVTYPAIKKVDPSAVIITGGLAPETTDNNNISQTDFLNCIYNNGGKNYFDAVGDHPYTFPALPSDNSTNTWMQMSVTSPSLRSIMIANGDANKKIWLTEYGTPTNGPDPHWFVSEQRQSDMVTDSMNLYKTYSWAGPIFWYSLKDAGTTTDTIENFFGLIRADGTLKPAYTTLKSAIASGL